MVINTSHSPDVLMEQINALSQQAKQYIIEQDLASADLVLSDRFNLIKILVESQQPAISERTRSFLQRLKIEDANQVAQLETEKTKIKSSQATTKRSAKSINQYLNIKQL